ncbi:MAG: V-type ATP synthase subunit E family protein [Planctomycetota bacterium]|nr:V-type ATP synthase subunit E family protein [Planctomycetota bacterium]
MLKDEILADARRQAGETAARAKKEAEALLAKARMEAENDRRLQAQAGEAEAKRRRDLTLATIPVVVGRRRAECIEQALNQIRSDAAGQLAARQGFDYRQAVIRLAADALAHMDGNKFVLEVADADQQALGQGWVEEISRQSGRSGLELSTAPAKTKDQAGVIIRDAQGRQVWDNTLPARLERLWPALRRELAVATRLVSGAETQKESQ